MMMNEEEDERLKCCSKADNEENIFKISGGYCSPHGFRQVTALRQG